MSINVHLERFEGPLGLLLHLIREQEMDIFNINIHHITRQYLEYIKTMRRLDLEVAGEFVAMAATLLHIKSRMLLPNYNEEGEEVSADPRKELVQKLLEYKKFQELSGDLYRRPLLGRDVFARGEREDVEALEEGELVLEEKPLFSLIAAYRFAIKNMKKTVHRVGTQLQSIGERIMEMKDLLVIGRRVVFGELITDRTPGKGQVLITFLSLLELAKMGFVSIFQTESFSDIHVEPKREINRDVISQVENYESVNAEAAADRIMVEAQAQLSLDESVLAPEDEAEGMTIVQESVADAASDEDIEAEERRLFAEESAIANDLSVSPEPTNAENPVAEQNVEPEIVAVAEESESIAVELSALTEEAIAPSAPKVEMASSRDYSALSFLTSPELPAEMDFVETKTEPTPSIEASASEPPSEGPEQAVLRAVSSAMAAFESLSEVHASHEDPAIADQPEDLATSENRTPEVDT